MTEPGLQPGATLGPYHLLRELGRGGMGRVFVAEDARLGRRVALKLMLAPGLRDGAARQRFLREARAMDRLQHPHVVRVLDAGEIGGHLYLASELVEGATLRAQVEEHGPLEPERAVELAIALAGALDAAHAQGMLHRDVKPENVLLDAQGAPKLTDFGLARLETDQRLTRTGEMLGTPAFMSPEQADGNYELHGPQSDVYGLGATLYFLLTGRPPFQASSTFSLLKQVLGDPPKPPRSLRPDLDPALSRLVLATLAKEPLERPASARELAAELIAWRDRAPSAVPRARTLAAALIALGGLAAAGLLVLVRPPAPAATPAPQPASPPSAPLAQVEPPDEPTPASPAPSSATLRLDVAALEQGAVPGLEVQDGLGITTAPRGGQGVLRFRADGQTHPALHVPLGWDGRAFTVEASLRLDLLEPSNSFALLLGDPAQRPLGLELRCQGPPRLQLEPDRFELVSWPSGATQVLQDLGVFSHELRLLLRWDPQQRRLLLEASVAGRSLLSQEVALPLTPGPRGLLPLTLGANLNRPPGDPTCLTRADLLALRLEGLVPRVMDQPPARVRQAAQVLPGLIPVERARELLPSVPLRGPLLLETRYLTTQVAADPGDRDEAFEQLWGDPDFQRRWPHELIFYPPDFVDRLASAFRTYLVKQYGELAAQGAWVHKYAGHRVWGNKGGVRAPAGGPATTPGAEKYWLQGDWVAAHAELAKAWLAFASLERVNQGPRGMARLYLGDLEGARTDIEQAWHDAKPGVYYMLGVLAEVNVRLGRWDEAWDQFQDYFQHMRRPNEQRPRYYEQRLLPLLERLRDAR